MINLVRILLLIASINITAQSPFQRSLILGNPTTVSSVFDTVDVVIYAGQSNAEGRADLSNVPAQYLSRIADEHPVNQIYWSDDDDKEWQKMDIPEANRRGGVQADDDFGSYVLLADTAYRYTGKEIWILQVTEGGTGLASDILNKDWNINTEDEQYQLLKNKLVNSRLSALKQKKILRYKAVVWMQGESDAEDSTKAANYEANLTDLINQFRTDTGIDVPWIVGRIQNYGATYTSQVRDAQVNVANTVTNVEWINTDSYTLRDYVHFDADGQIQFGFDTFQKLLSIGVF